jgi:hypothetical protein
MILNHFAPIRRNQGSARARIGLSGLGSIVGLLILLNFAASLA